MTDADNDPFGDLGDDLGGDEDPGGSTPDAEEGEPAGDVTTDEPVADGAVEPAEPTDSPAPTVSDRGRDRPDDRADTTVDAPGAEATRDRQQYTAYLPADLIAGVNDRFAELNARRQLDDLPQIEKNKGFHEAIFRHFLETVEDEELLVYVPEYGYDREE